MPAYTIQKTTVAPEFTGAWDGPVWSRAETLTVNLFHPASSGHRPGVQARALYEAKGIYVIFKVKDRYVRSVNTQPQGPVCRDSCVEFFFEPKPGAGYLNMEANCGGTFLCFHITNSTRTPGGFKTSVKIDPSWFSQIKTYHSLPAVVDPELTAPTEWILEYFIPFALIEAYAGPLGAVAGQTWRGNFYKCGDQTSHPHWASWAPIGDELNFHQPAKFAPITFGK